MEWTTAPPPPADYFRRHAARLSHLAAEATTPAVKRRLLDVVLQYERLAERADAAETADGN